MRINSMMHNMYDGNSQKQWINKDIISDVFAKYLLYCGSDKAIYSSSQHTE